MAPNLFQRAIGIECFGAATPTTSLKGLRVYMAIPRQEAAEVPPPGLAITCKPKIKISFCPLILDLKNSVSKTKRSESKGIADMFMKPEQSTALTK